MDKLYDVAVIGGGPAGASAAIYAVRGGLSVVMLHTGVSALARAEKIDNYYGAPSAGAELYARGIKQAEELGADIKEAQVVSAEAGERFVLGTTAGNTVSRALIVATGASRMRPDIDGISEYEGKGISYCAVCDAFFYRKKRVGVIGAGRFAEHEYGVLSSVAGEAILLTNGKKAEFTAKNSIEKRIARVSDNNGRLGGVVFEDGSALELDGIFVALGVMGGGSLAKTLGIATDAAGAILTEGGRTNVPLLYAAGDCTVGIKQVAKAVCDGMTAALAAIKDLRGRSGNA